MTHRFKPIEAGIIGLWDYTEQRFHFADGRLVLRGANGSGKTKALEVLYPFVLDGSLDPRRLDPFSGKERTMRSNLLYGGEKARHGYCWLTFARGAEAVTVGVGLRARESSPDVDSWFFVADGRVGVNFDVLDEGRRPVTRKDLEGRLPAGAVHQRREEHRTAVDRRLFRVGPERYEALIQLVLTLRRPQLAQGLDPDRLSDVLTEGLRTVDDALLRDSADAFEELEAVQRELGALEQAHAAVDDLLGHWRAYLRVRARDRVDAWRARATRLAQAEAGVLRAEESARRLRADATAASAIATGLAHDATAVGARLAGLKDSAAWRDQGQLVEVRRQAHTAEKERARTEARLMAAAKRLADAEEARAERREAHARATRASDAARSELAARLRPLDHAAPEAPEGLDATLAAWRIDLEAVLEQLQAVEAAAHRLAADEAHVQQARAALEVASEGEASARVAVEEAVSALDDALVRWHAALADPLATSLALDPLRALVPELGAGAELGAHVDAAWAPLREALTVARVGAERAIRAHDEALASLDAQIQAIRDARDDAPPAAPHRPAQRLGRPGGPLWRLVRFGDHVADADRAGLEGALLAAGLLDAWIDVDASPRPDDTEDAFLRAGAAIDGPSLADVLVPEALEGPAPGVPVAPPSTARVRAVLASVPLGGDLDVAVDVDGRIRLGPLAATHRPATARYIGATARAQHRARRIAALEVEQARVAADRAEQVRARDAADALRRALDQARAGLPGVASLRRAHDALTGAVAVTIRLRAQHAEAAARRDQSARAHQACERAFVRAAAERGLPSDAVALRARAGHLSAIGEALDAWRKRRDDASTAATRAEDAEAAWAREQQDHAAAGDEHAQRETTHLDARTRLETLESTLGVEVRLLQKRIDEDERALASLEAQRKAAEAEVIEAERQAATFDGKAESLRESLPELEADRHDAERALAPFDLLACRQVLGVGADDAPFPERLDRAVQGVVATEEQHKATETRVSRRLQELDGQLGGRFASAYRLDDGILQVVIRDESGEHGLPTFADRLARRRDETRALLSDHERRLFQDQVLTSLVSQLRHRIDDTRALVDEMDRAMGERRLAGRRTMGIAWQPDRDLDAERRAFLDLLRFDPAHLGPDRLEGLRRHLSDEVQAARRERPDRGYLDILREVLDYRRWHRFTLSLTDASGARIRLTRAQHAKLSGGEKASTLHLPLFAAAHAHLAAAAPEAPRLVALDEAFAGIDASGVPELLRLATAFDLDLFVTGYDLWLTEPFLPGVMHYDLAHDPIARVVSAWPIRWDGERTLEGDEASG